MRLARLRQWLAAHGVATLPLAAAVVAGTWLRCQQWSTQVLIDDEWHLVHRLVLATPREMYLDFGYSDYGIPLGLFYAALARVVPLSEAALRLPTLVAGIVTLVVLPLLVRRRIGLVATTMFAWLLAISPLLILYSRLARPYALVLLLVWIVAFALVRWQARRERALALATGVVVASVLAVWLHLAAVCFIIAAFALAAIQTVRAPWPAARSRLLRLGVLALATALPGVAVLLPPVLAHPQALALKSGLESPDLDTLLAAWFAWVGTASSWMAALAALLAAVGLIRVLRAIPECRAPALGAILTGLLLEITRPASSGEGIVLARYVLPALPVALLAIAVGVPVVAHWMAPQRPRAARVMAGVAGALLCAVLLTNSPVREWWQRPNRQTLHMQTYFDFRPGHNRYGQHLDAAPHSAFWRSLATRPPNSVRVAVAPFYFESFDWNAPQWERESRQTVIPAHLSGLCVDWRWGEVPRQSRFAFRNAVRLDDSRDLAAKAIDFIVWQKPYRRGTDVVGEDTAHCADALRERFGAPTYEDAAVAVFALRGAREGQPQK